MTTYTTIPVSALPASLRPLPVGAPLSWGGAPEARWSTPMRHQGQAIEVSYSTGAPSSVDADVGALYRRTTDHSVGPRAHTYARLMGGV